MADSSVLVHIVRDAGTKEAREFTRFPHRLYAGCPQWVPWFDKDVIRLMARTHPFFDHSEAEFLVAERDGRTVGRIMVLHNTRYNEKHGSSAANFALFDSVDDQAVATALMEAAESWARERGLDTIIGPMLFGGASGSGLLIDGYEHRAAMTMMPYNRPYYRRLVENLGFEKKIDYVSAAIDPKTFTMPDKIRRVAHIAKKRGRFGVKTFRTKSELRAVAGEIGSLYNEVLGAFNEGHTLSDAEVNEITRSLITVADPALITILTYGGEVAGFLLAFPDLSRAMQKSRGKLNLLSVLRLLLETRRTRSLILNGAGILPRFQRLGGNALLYTEIENTVNRKRRLFKHADLTQVAESTDRMLADLMNLGARIYKTHRVYQRRIQGT